MVEQTTHQGATQRSQESRDDRLQPGFAHGAEGAHADQPRGREPDDVDGEPEQTGLLGNEQVDAGNAGGDVDIRRRPETDAEQWVTLQKRERVGVLANTKRRGPVGGREAADEAKYDLLADRARQQTGAEQCAQREDASVAQRPDQQ